ncbi:MAG: trypsin-like serine protease, partial [Kiloniellaceae bacterium]
MAAQQSLQGLLPATPGANSWNEEPFIENDFPGEAPADLGPPGSAPGGASTIPKPFRDPASEDDQSDAGGSGGREAESPNWNFSATTEEDFGTKDIFDNESGNRKKFFQKKYPWRTIGKLFFTTPGGNAFCSASVISPNNNIVTAAHCCHAGPGGGFFTN